MRIFNWLYKLTRWGLGGIFLYAGTVKLMDPKAFATVVEAYGILPESLLMAVAIFLPTLELTAGIGLVFDIRGSLAIIAGLLGLFIVILSYGIWLGLDIDCGCFGPHDPEANAFHGLRSSLYRDIALMAGVVFLYGWRRYRAIEPVRFSTLTKQRLKKRNLDNEHA